MQVAEDANLIRIVVSQDNTVARLVILQGFPRQMITRELCLNLIREANVQVTDEANRAIDQLLAQDKATLEPVELVIAQAQPPCHGKDGKVRWLLPELQKKCEQAANVTPDKTPENTPAVTPEKSHYDRSAFITVKAGQLIAKVIPPEPAVDGIDVRGGNIPAKLGREMKFDLDESLLLDANAQVIAQIDGVLQRTGQKLRIRQVIEIDQYVDFSTGHIDFDGDVIIHKGVRDCFVVKAKGNVQVDGLIEAATVQCGGDLNAAGGFAGREQGKAEVGGNMSAKYLDNIHACIKGDLKVEREIVNCDIQTDGAILATHGAIIGGRITPTGKIDVGMLGSPAGVATEIILGKVPTLENFLQRLQPLLQVLEKNRDKMLEEQKQLDTLGRRATPAHKERQTEIMFELAQVNQQWLKAQMAAEALQRTIDQRKTVQLHISRKLNAGVSVTVANQRFTMKEEMRGPVQICLDTAGSVVYKQGQGPQLLLADVARIKAA